MKMDSLRLAGVSIYTNLSIYLASSLLCECVCVSVGQPEAGWNKIGKVVVYLSIRFYSQRTRLDCVHLTKRGRLDVHDRPLLALSAQ